jgi:predicted secreted protein
MSASAAVSGYATTLKRATVAIAEVVGVQGPSATRDSIEVTHLTSDNGWKEFLGGLKDGGEVSFTLNWLSSNSGHVQIAADFVSGSLIAWAIEPSGVSADAVSFSAFVSKFAPNADKSKQLDAAVTLKISGAVTYA